MMVRGGGTSTVVECIMVTAKNPLIAGLIHERNVVTAVNEVCGKVIFLLMCVILSTGGGGCVVAGGACVVAGGMHGCGGGHAWLQGSSGGMCMVAGGVCGCGGMCGCGGGVRGCGGMHGGGGGRVWNTTNTTRYGQ